MKIIKVITSIIISLAINNIAFFTSAHADNGVYEEHPEWYAGFVVEPMNEKLELSAGELHSGHFTIKNTTNADLIIEATIGPYTMIDDGAMSDFQTMTSRNEIVNWTSITHGSSSSIEVKAGETRTVGYIIDVPNGAETGEQMEVVMLKPTTPNEYGYLNQVGFTISATIVKRAELLDIASVILCAILVVAILTFGIFAYIMLFKKKDKRKRC